MKQIFYDNVSKEWIGWEPLGDLSRYGVARGLGERAIQRITALGTCGNPSNPDYASHRTEILFPILQEYGIELRDVNNPEVPEWDPSRAPIEGIWAARSKVISAPVTNQTNGAASIVETCLATYGGFLRGQHVFTLIESNDQTPEKTKVARDLALSVLKAIETRFPLFTLSSNLNVLANQVAVCFSNLQRQGRGDVAVRSEYELPPIRNDLTPAIYLSGSAGKTRPAWMKILNDKIRSLKADVVLEDSYHPRWDSSKIADELVKKLSYAVQIEVVADDTEALGALAETGARIMQADLSGQSYGLLVAPNYPKSPLNSDSNRARILLLEHLSRLRQDFPNLPVFIADNLDDLALFAVGSYVQQRARLNTQ